MSRMTAPFLMLLALAGAAHAQQPPATASDAFERAAEAADLVRVTTNAGLSFEGAVAFIDADVVRIDSSRVLIADVVRIERGEPGGGGGRTGLIAGAVIMGTMFVVLSYTLADDPEFDAGTAGPIALAGIVSGAILGGLIGADLDPPRVEWREIWPVEVSW